MIENTTIVSKTSSFPTSLQHKHLQGILNIALQLQNIALWLCLTWGYLQDNDKNSIGNQTDEKVTPYSIINRWT